MRICVFCAASSKIDKSYIQAAHDIADVLADNGITAVYGGGSTGLMGALADRMIERKARVIGIIPYFLKDAELEHKEVLEMVITEDMRTRKKLMIEGIDAILTMPGGIGTFEELLEVMTLNKLGQLGKPIIIFNVNGYFDPLIAMFERSIEENFMGEVHRNLWTVITKADELLDAIKDSHHWGEDSLEKAVLK